MEQEQEIIQVPTRELTIAFLIVIFVIIAIFLFAFPYSPFREIGPWNHYVIDTFGEDFLSGLR